MHWNDSIQFLKGVGPQRALRFEKLEIKTIGSLLAHYPRTYIDYSSPVSVASAPTNLPCVVRATVLSKNAAVRISSGRSMQHIICADESAGLKLVFFNNPYVAKNLEINKEYLFYGKVAGNLSGKEMVAPSFLPAQTDAPLAPIYPLTEGLSSKIISSCVANAFSLVKEIPEPLPAHILSEYKLVGKKEAISNIHKPKNMKQVQAARRRLIFEELFLLQLGLLLMRGRNVLQTSAPMEKIALEVFFKALPFKPTKAQQRASGEITKDLMKKTPMNRLLQGDVGSGKTLVAAAAVFFAARNGFQSVLMAPTEILAQQHANTLEQMLAPLGIGVALLTGSVKGKTRKAVLAAIENGQAVLIVGTHAVLSEPVKFSRLGLAITDEQHRFGVRQRAMLASKADCPHLLVMSATPIPRTLGLLMFGDLDISVLDELPPGRKGIKTFAVTGQKRKDMFGFLAKQIEAGRQAYIVCPLIEEGESDLQAAADYAQQIAQPLLPNARVGLMHGKLKAADKAAVMNDFKNHKLDLLVSTTVIEVGVDVPNATVMVIEDAERYGLSALHQLRGRVGRGANESFCILVTDHATEVARERLRFLCRTQDGFEVAKYDLETRGPGDFFGNRQHGLPTLQLADLATDTKTLEFAQLQAVQLLKKDPELKNDENRNLKKAVDEMFGTISTMN